MTKWIIGTIVFIVMWMSAARAVEVPDRGEMDAVLQRLQALELFHAAPPPDPVPDPVPDPEPVPDPGPLPDPEPDPVPPPGAYADLAECAADIEPGGWSTCGSPRLPLMRRSEMGALDAQYGGNHTWGTNGSGCVLKGWTDGAWDPGPARMYFHGGGHACYAGSEWYAFDTTTLTAERLDLPGVFNFGEQIADFRWPSGTVIPAGTLFNPWVYPPDWPHNGNFSVGDEPFPLGLPLPPAGPEGVAMNPTHSYGAMAMHPPSGEIFRFGGNHFYRKTGNGGFDLRFPPKSFGWPVFSYNPEHKRWTYWGSTSMEMLGPTTTAKASYDPVSGKIIIATGKGVAVFDPAKFMVDALQAPDAQDSYSYQTDTRVGITYPILEPESFLRHANSGGVGNSAVAPDERLFVMYGKNGTRVYRIIDGVGIADAAGGVTRLERIGGIGANAGPYPPTQGGFDWHPVRKLFVLWDGTRHTWTFDPVAAKYTYYPNAQSELAPPPGSELVFGKWRYIPEFDLFAGYPDENGPMWFYRLPPEPGPDTQRIALEAAGFTCADSVWGWPCPDLQGLVDATPAGGTLTLPKGVYRSCAVIRQPITIDGTAPDGTRAVVEREVCNGKAAFQAKANLTLVGIECRRHGNHQNNQSCIRREEKAFNITMRNVYCHDSSTCLLGRSETGRRPSGTIVIENSIFGRLGGDGGRSHGLYLRGVERVEVTNTVFRCMVGQGHHLKTGARSTVVENVQFDGGGLDCTDSRLIDNFACGSLAVIRSELIESDARDQRSMIDWCPGSGPLPDRKFFIAPEPGERRVLSITESSFDCDSADAAAIGIAVNLPQGIKAVAWMLETPEDLDGDPRFSFEWADNTLLTPCKNAPPVWPPAM